MTMSDAAFSAFLAAFRPRLHRYCARMVGSVLDGEDVLQEALAKAIEAWPAAGTIERPEAWLLRIAHNAALDALRRSRRQASLFETAEFDTIEDDAGDAGARVAANASLATLMHLPPVQRSSVVLIDVLGHSLAETAQIIDSTVPAVKAALHRARANLERVRDDEAAPSLAAAQRARLRAYADRFNARDFDALRALLAEDVKLDLVDRVKWAGKSNVAVYFTRYDGTSDWKFAVGHVEGRELLLVSDPATGALTYVVELGWNDDEKIVSIRDFRFATYVLDGLVVDRENAG